MSVVFVNVAMVHAKPVQVEAVNVTKLLTWRPPRPWTILWTPVH